MLVSITPAQEFDAVKIVQMVLEKCLGIVIECGYTPAFQSLVDSYNHFEIPKRLKF